MSGTIENNISNQSGSIAVAPAGLNWVSSVVTASTVTVVAGNGYWINTTSNTITLPASAEAGDNIVIVDYARTWGTNNVELDSNGLNFQGNADTYEVKYSTDGQSVNLIYSDSTKGWIPLEDDVVAEAPVAPTTQRAIFGFGQTSGNSITGTTNLVNSSGVVQGDVTAVGVARRQLTATNFGGDRAIFFGGVTANGIANASAVSNLVSNAGVVASNTSGASGVGVRIQQIMSPFGADGKAIIAFGTIADESATNIRNLISNAGVIAADISGAGGVKTGAASAKYGSGLAIAAFGNNADNNLATSNLINNVGVVGSDVGAVGTVRTSLAGTGFGGDKAVFYAGNANGGPVNTRNLVSNVGVVAADASGAGTARTLLSGAPYGGDKGIFWGGGGFTNTANLVSNTGVVSANQTGAGTAKNNAASGGYGYSA